MQLDNYLELTTSVGAPAASSLPVNVKPNSVSRGAGCGATGAPYPSVDCNQLTLLRAAQASVVCSVSDSVDGSALAGGEHIGT